MDNFFEPNADDLTIYNMAWEISDKEDEIAQLKIQLKAQPRAEQTHAVPFDSPAPEQDVSRKKNKGCIEETKPYILQIFRAGQYSTAKELFDALEKKVGIGDSPFTRGEGTHRGDLYVKSINKHLTSKTFSNNWASLKNNR